MDVALYGPAGFYTLGGGAGRRRDFITSPELGPLFGAVIARALDTWWDELGCPDPFLVAECGAGPGALCRDVLRAAPRCAGALRYVMVDAALPMRDAQRGHGLPLVEPFELLGAVVVDDEGDHVVGLGQGPLVCSLAELPTEPMHVVLANELFDNLPFDVARRRADGWDEVRVGVASSDGSLAPVAVALDEERASVLDGLVGSSPVGATVPLAHVASSWIGAALDAVRSLRGRVVVVDYGGSMAELAGREGQWLRTYRGHERGVDPFAFAGSCDITGDVPVDFVSRVHRPTVVRTQAEFLRAHGIDALVDEARAVWTSRAALGDLTALRARSRVGEGEALCDPAGLGGFVVMEWTL